MTTRVLVLDDDAHVRGSLALALEDENFCVLEAESAEEALTLLQATTADVAVVDLRLPGMDGAGFITAAHTRWPELRFIIYTGSPELHVPTALTEQQNVSNAIFFKPLKSFGPLLEEIERMVGQE